MSQARPAVLKRKSRGKRSPDCIFNDESSETGFFSFIELLGYVNQLNLLLWPVSHRAGVPTSSTTTPCPTPSSAPSADLAWGDGRRRRKKKARRPVKKHAAQRKKQQLEQGGKPYSLVNIGHYPKQRRQNQHPQRLVQFCKSHQAFHHSPCFSPEQQFYP